MLIPLLMCSCLCVLMIGDVKCDIFEESQIFRKCCEKNQSLVKVTQNDTSFLEYFECIDRDAAERTYNVSNAPLFVGDNVLVEYGLPEQCDEMKMSEMVESEIELKNSVRECYDRLIVDLNNGTVKPQIPKTVLLTCVQKETEEMLNSRMKIYNIRKCCPKGKVFDAEYHLCRELSQLDSEDSEDWLLSRLNLTDYIYSIDYGLHCKTHEYAVEITEDKFILSVRNSSLDVVDRLGDQVRHAPSGEWCLDQDYKSSVMMARVCARDCSTYDAFCVRKCCPVGEHYRPRRCGSPISTCVPNTDDEVLFNISSYIEPLRSQFDIPETLGVRSNLICPAGRFILNDTSETDRHWLTHEGLLESVTFLTQDYCLEAFDRRRCGEDVVVTGVACFIEAPEANKDFFMSFILNSISAVCLALTLAVYIWLPELRNLHGRTIICHVSTMLFAYSCLARVQYGRVVDNRVCTMLGYGIYFGFVAAFAWLNVMCFDIWWTFGSVRTVQSLRKPAAERRRFIWYSLYAWIVALSLTTTMLMFDMYPVSRVLDANIGNGICWFGSLQNTQTDWPHYIFFVIPMGLITCTNFVLWALTARHCARVKSEVHRLQAGSVGDRAKRRFRIDRANYVLTGKLWVVMGAGWISELLSTLTTEPQWLWIIVDLMNELQGVFIFLILVFKIKVFNLIRKKLGLEKPDAQKNGTSSTARTSSTFLSRTISSDERTNLRASLPGKQA